MSAAERQLAAVARVLRAVEQEGFTSVDEIDGDLVLVAIDGSCWVAPGDAAVIRSLLAAS